jgi:hypothetical protein
MGVVTAVAAFVVLAFIDEPNLATLISALLAGFIAGAVTTYQRRRER